jgi:hypothetical protein|tara:strand:- start:208 stop:666 length:459 start_codon:yes stop_codon:yes gene_type:complete
MGDFDTGKEVNSKKFQVFIGSTSNEWKLVQNARVTVSHPIFREPTTSGGVVTFTGAPDNSISGTLLFTYDEWTTANTSGVTNVAGLKALLTPDAVGEVIPKTWLIKFTSLDASASNTTLTFANCKLSVADISKSVEGAVKVDISVVCPSDPS